MFNRLSPANVGLAFLDEQSTPACCAPAPPPASPRDLPSPPLALLPSRLLSPVELASVAPTSVYKGPWTCACAKSVPFCVERLRLDFSIRMTRLGPLAVGTMQPSRVRHRTSSSNHTTQGANHLCGNKITTRVWASPFMCAGHHVDSAVNWAMLRHVAWGQLWSRSDGVDQMWQCVSMFGKRSLENNHFHVKV